jgi:hypothetical protein
LLIDDATLTDLRNLLERYQRRLLARTCGEQPTLRFCKSLDRVPGLPSMKYATHRRILLQLLIFAAAAIGASSATNIKQG